MGTIGFALRTMGPSVAPQFSQAACGVGRNIMRSIRASQRLQERRAPVKGTAAPARPASDGYEECKVEIAIRMGHFFVRYLSRLYREFDGDMALVIVLGEIGHHNTSQFYSAEGPVPSRAVYEPAESVVWGRLTPCNAFSLSVATGIPRETVRRKIAWLIKRGWVKQKPNGEVCILPAVSEHFTTDFNPQTLRELLELSDQLRGLLAPHQRSRTPVSPQKTKPPTKS